MTTVDQEQGKLPKGIVLRKLGRNLAALRGRRDWSQEKLAGKVGVTRSCIGKWETGEHGPSFEWLAALAAALEVGLEEIVGGIVPRP
jgi:transcriptional regulator with XRE-family HTH domain